MNFLKDPKDYHLDLKRGFVKHLSVAFVCLVVYLISVLMTSCHALIVADHLTYSGTIAKKRADITVRDSTKIVTTQSENE